MFVAIPEIKILSANTSVAKTYLFTRHLNCKCNNGSAVNIFYSLYKSRINGIVVLCLFLKSLKMFSTVIKLLMKCFFFDIFAKMVSDI